MADASKNVAAEIIRARIAQLSAKLQEAADRAASTKEQYEELAETIEEFKKANIPQEEIQRLFDRQQKRGEENKEAFDEFNRIKARINELQELVGILEGDK